MRDAQIRNDLLHIFYQANKLFLSKNMSNINFNVSERNFVSLLMYEITLIVDSSKYNNYYVDVEYNRNKGKVKTVYTPGDTPQGTSVMVLV